MGGTGGRKITDELRAWIERYTMSGERYRELLAIVGRIDERHEQMQYDYQHEFDGWKFIRDTQWVELPVDADGVPIEIGDYLHCDETGKDFPCRGYCCSVGKDGERRWTVECSYDPYSGTSEYVSATRCHHVQPDSWERIIEDAVKNGMYDHDNERIQQKLVERCRRLAGAE